MKVSENGDPPYESSIHMSDSPEFTLLIMLCTFIFIVLTLVYFIRMKLEQVAHKGRLLGLEFTFNTNFTPKGIRFRNRTVLFGTCGLLTWPVLVLLRALLAS